LNSQVFEGIYTGEVFKNVHPDKDFQNEGATANDAFKNLSSRIEKDPALAALVQQMTFVDPAVDPHEQRFAERWQSIFKDSGAILPAIERKQLLEIDRHLANLRTQFSSNIINAQRKWQVPLSDLEGMPDDFLKSHPADEGGHVTLTTQYMDLCRTLTYCKTDKVRQKIWSEYCARCPENIQILQQIIEECHTKAHILGYPNYAAFDLQGRLTLKGLDNVNQFIDEAIAIAKPCALQEKKVRAQVYGANNLKVWQSDYAKEILSQHHAGFDSSQIRPYLRVGNVLPQIALLIQELFGVQFHHRPDIKGWTETGVECYDVYDDEQGKLMGRLYTDVSTTSQ
jgi:thimet oligopeptidase